MTDFNKGRLHKEIYGQGRPVVMLHGWAMHTGVWRTFAQALAENSQVVCLDLPGHGLSKSVTPYTLESIVEAIVRELPEEACVLVGWSLGGNVAMHLAEKYPQRISSLVLLAYNPYFIKTDLWPGVPTLVLTEFANNLQKNSIQTLLRFTSLQLQGRSDAKLYLKKIKLAMQECAMPTSEILMAGLSVLQTVDQRSALSHLNIPVLMVLGEQDTLVPESVGEQCRLLQARLELIIMVGAGHTPFLTDQQKLLSIMHDFIQRG